MTTEQDKLQQHSPPDPTTGHAMVAELRRRLCATADRYAQVLRIVSVNASSAQLDVHISEPAGSLGAFGALLRLLHAQGALAPLIAGYLRADSHSSFDAQAAAPGRIVIDFARGLTQARVDAMAAAVDAMADALAHQRSDLLCRHLSGSPAPAQTPHQKPEPLQLAASHTPEPQARCVALRAPQPGRALTRLDASLDVYSDAEAQAVGEALGAALQPFQARSFAVGTDDLLIGCDEVWAMGAPKVASSFDLMDVLNSRRCATHFLLAVDAAVHAWHQPLQPSVLGDVRIVDGIAGASVLLEQIFRHLAAPGRLGGLPVSLKVAGAGPMTSLENVRSAALQAGLQLTDGGTGGASIVVIDPTFKNSLGELAENSVLIDLDEVWTASGRVERRPRNVIHVRSLTLVRGSHVLHGEQVGWLWAALLEVLLPAWAADRRAPRDVQGEVALAVVASSHGLHAAALHGASGEIDEAEWREFHARRRRGVTDASEGVETSASRAARWPRDAASEDPFELIFSSAHLAATASVVDPASGQRLSYAELLDLTKLQLARLHSLGVERGQVVAVVDSDDIPGTALMLGCLLGDIVFAPLNSRNSTQNLASMLAAAEPVLVLYPAAAAHEHACLATQARACEMERFLAIQPVARGFDTSEPVSPARPSVLLFTSGSTGTPKAVVHKRGDFVATALNYGSYVLQLKSTDCLYTPSRMSFAYGLNNLMLGLLSGSSIVLASGNRAGPSIAETIIRHAVTVFMAVPAVYKRLLSGAAWSSPSQLRLCVSAGERLPAALYHAIESELGVPVLDGIGCTESLSTFISNRATCRVPGSTGVVVPGFQVRLVNAAGKLCRCGEVGVLWLRGYTLADGYRGDAVLTEMKFEHGWFNTQDMFYTDYAGRFHHVGRSTSAIKINGCWLSPELLESTLETHPAVSECAVCPVADDYGLPRPRAFVVLRPSFSIERLDELWDELRTLAKNSLGKDHYPHLFSTTQSLPRTVSGKLHRDELVRSLRAQSE